MADNRISKKLNLFLTMDRRKGKKRKAKPFVMIFCEDTKSAFYYFGSIAEQIDKDKNKYNFEVIPKDTEKTTAVQLVEEARSYITEHDKDNQFWVVFDKNGYTMHEKAFKLAKTKKKGKKVNIAFSSIAFEHWVLLHYEQNKTPFPKSRNIIDHFDGSGHYPDYKKADIIYPELRDKTETAIENAAWLRREMKDELDRHEGKIYEINPYTDIDRLISLLLNLDREISWGHIRETLKIGDLNVQVISISQKKSDLIVEVSLENNQSHAHLENNETKNFYLIDNKKKRIDCKIDKSVLIKPGEKKNFKLTFPDSVESDSGRLNFCHKNYLLIIGY